MMRSFFSALLAVVTILVLLAVIVHGDKTQYARLYLSYCPTYFSSEIAVVDVSTADGSYKIVGKATPPSSIVFGCSALYSPTFTFEPTTGDIMFDFTSDLGAFIQIQVNDTTGHVDLTHFTSPSEFFTGFESFRLDTARNTLVGISGTATQDNFCSDGCMGFATLDLATRRAKTIPLPFKAVSDDTCFFDQQNQLFYTQLSHAIPGTPYENCAPLNYGDCLVVINATNGEIVNSVNNMYDNNEHVYRFGLSSAVPDLDHVQAFVIGENCRCNVSSQQISYAFDVVDLPRNKFSLQSCAQNNVTIQTDEWISSFLPIIPNEPGRFVTSSGNSDGDSSQFLVFDVENGGVMLNTQLKGLGKALGAEMGLIYIWGVGGQRQLS